MSIDTASGKLRRALSDFEDNPPAAVIEQDEVLDEFQPIFDSDEVGEISKEQFLRFLPFKNNRHWSGLARQGPRMTDDMEELRRGLTILLDEDRELAPRVTEAKSTVDGMGKGTLSAILLVAYPEQYGVWNNTSEGALKQLEVWPDFERGSSFGEKYVRVNQVLQDLSAEVDVDLWTLDSLLNRYLELIESEGEESLEPIKEGNEFVAEKHLQDFLVENWESIELSESWEIYSNEADPEAGVEFPTEVGRIDLLTKHKHEPRIRVIELKKSRSSDKAVGQLLRYVGWVEQHITEFEGMDSEAEVEGVLIVSEPSDRLTYSISAVRNLSLQTYRVDFELATIR